MPNNLVALFSVFNEAKFIGDSVKRIAPWVGRIHVFDGRINSSPQRPLLYRWYAGNSRVYVPLCIHHITVKRHGTAKLPSVQKPWR